jgi:phosphoglycerate kinase
VLDGFGVCHRAQASVSGVARLLPRRFPGPLVRRELHFLGAALDAPQRPFGVVLGGMKARARFACCDALKAMTSHATITARRFATRSACCGR